MFFSIFFFFFFNDTATTEIYTLSLHDALPIWQRKAIKGDMLHQQAEYWKKALDAAPALMELPLDHPRPLQQHYAGAFVELVLGEKLTDALKELGRRHGTTLFMTLLAGWAALLAKVSGQEDLLIGTPVANRGRTEIEGLIGFFVNTLALRLDLANSLSVGALLKQVKAQTTAAQQHQDIPFEQVVELVNPVRSLSHSPLFQVMFAWQNAPRRPLDLPGIKADLILSAAHSTAKFDLTLSLREEGATIAGGLQYATSLFEPATAKRFLGYLGAILEGMVIDDAQPVGRLSPLSSSERNLLLHQWNDTRSGFPGEKCVQQLFEEQAALTPDARAVISAGESLLYGELNQRANQLAHYLKRQGVRPELQVAICMERSPEMVVGMLGILKAGGVYLPLDPTYPADRLTFTLQDADVAIVLTQEKLKAALPAKIASLLCLDSDWSQIASERKDNPEVICASQNLAYVMYTSGSTGQPKGVMIAHHAITRLVCNSDYVHLAAADSTAQTSNNSFDAATFEIWGALLNGGRVVLMPEAETLDPQRYAKWTEGQGITTAFLTTALFNEMVRQGVEFRGMKQVLFGGEMVDATLVRKAKENGKQERLLHVYGPTEGTTFSTWYEVNAVDEQARNVPIGRGIANTQVYVLGKELDLTPVGVPGELCIGGAGLSRGYWRRPALTAEKFVPDPHSNIPGDRLYRTGDRVRWTSEGVLEFLGRTDDQVKIRGFRVELGEIETVLADCPGGEAAVVLVREDTPGQRQIVGYVVPQGKKKGAVAPGLLSGDSIREYLRTKLPEYLAPGAIVLLDELPLTQNGKVDRQKLPDPREAGVQMAEDGEYAAPETPVEEIICGIWEEVLHRQRIGVHDNFFELSGHSLLAMQVVARIRKALRVELPLRRLFEEPTVAGIAKALQAERSAGENAVSSIERVDRNQALPLSYAQQRLWFIDQMEPGSTAYNIPLVMRLKGPLQIEALRQSVTQLISRHESLRTQFAWMHGATVQVIVPHPQFEMKVEDLRGRPNQQQELQAQIQAGIDQIFDLGRAPLLRVRLLQLDEQEYILLLTVHHIVSDGWSLGVFARELSLLYRALIVGKPPQLPELAIHYVDFAEWQRQSLEHGALEKQLHYWDAQLQGSSGVLGLKTDYARPPVKGWRGRIIRFALPDTTTERLRMLCRTQDVTLFMMLLAAAQSLFSRYTGETDVSVGTAIANRMHQETENLIGFFANTLVLRTDLSGNPAFLELLKRVREVALGAYAHQDVPFEKIVERLQPARDLSRTPLFQATLVLQNAGSIVPSLEGLQTSLEPKEFTNCSYDLSIEAHERGNGLGFLLRYDMALFAPNTIDRMGAQLAELLRCVAENPESRIAELTQITEVERRQVTEWNRTGREYQPCASVHELFEEQARQNPDQKAVVFGSGSLTYRELNQRANRLAHYLRYCGVGREMLVGVCVERSVQMIVALLGILKSGAAYVPLDVEYPQERIGYMVQDSEVGVVVTQQSLLDRLPSYELSFVQILCLDRDAASIEEQSERNPEVISDGDDLAYVMYTSGSTGKPKGVMITHGSVLNFSRWQQESCGISVGDRVSQLATLSFDASVFEIWPHLCAGATLYIGDDEIRMSPESLGRWAADQQIDVMFATTAVAEMLLEGGLLQRSRLRALLTRGDQLRRYAPAGSSFGLWNHCGPTEVTIAATAGRVPEECFGREKEKQRPVPAIGKPLANTQVYVVGDEMTLSPVGAPGELCVGGEGLARGYWRRADLTAEKFVPNPYRDNAGERLYRTGDWVRWLAEGELEFLGRIDDQVKIRGYRVEPAETEAVLGGHEAVKTAVVVVDRNPDGEKRLVGYVVAKTAREEGKAEPLSRSQLREYLRGRVPDYMVPSAIIVLDDMPLAPNGKVDRRKLPSVEEVGAGDGEREYEGPRTPVEETLCGIWCELLHVERVGIHDNFFELGGHSLLVTQVVSRIRQALEMELPIAVIFENPTVAGIAELVQQEARPDGQREAVKKIERVSRDERLPLSYAQQRLWFIDQLEPGSAAYNVSIAFRLKGQLRIDGLQRALDRIVDRHEALRTHFAYTDNGPVQVIEENGRVLVEAENLGARNVEEYSAAIQQWVAHQVVTPFDLGIGPLLRVKVLKLGERDSVLSLCIHHIVSDGWSIGLLLQELSVLYAAHVEQRTLELKELPVQYADFAVWQRGWLEGGALAEQLGYWNEQLRGATHVLELPADYQRSTVKSWQGEVRKFSIDAGSTEALGRVSQQADATLF